MAFSRFPNLKKISLVMATACLCGLVTAGCNDRVQVTRDPDIRIHKGATWAWQPVVEPVAARDSRRVTSRDNMGHNEVAAPVAREVTGNSQLVRDRVKTSIQQSLTAKGLAQVSDPATAEFLVDYHFAVEQRSAVQPLYPGAYPGLVCGPYRCWEGWGYGPAGYERIHFREGTIVFDLTQQATQHLVYRAVGEKPVRRDTFSLTQDEINGLVNHLLKDLKARK
jgi:hypothetical protein